MISTQPAHSVFSVPLHHLPAFWTRIPAQLRDHRLEPKHLQRENPSLVCRDPPGVNHLLCGLCVFEEQLSGLLLVLNTRQPERHVIKTSSAETFLLLVQFGPGWQRQLFSLWISQVPDGDVIHDLSEH